MKSNWVGILAQFEFYLPQILCEKHKLHQENDVQQTRKQYKEILLSNNFIRENLLFQIIQKLIYTHNIKADKDLMKNITTLLSKANLEQADDEDIINYNRWLNNKLR